MIYRTVTINPEIIPCITAEANLIKADVTVSHELYDALVETDVELTDRQVDILSVLSEDIIEIDAEIYTDVQARAEGADYYEGEYEYTPSRSAQMIPISGKLARRNVTINPIPDNYGLITWNGSVLTVS